MEVNRLTSDSPRVEFATHLLNDDGIAKAKQIAMKFSELTDYLETVCTSGREFSIVKTKLEEAAFFAKKAMAVNLANQKQ